MSALSITVEVRSVYGRDTIYPVCDAGKAFASIAGTTTLTVPVLKQIMFLGYEVRYQRPAPPAELERVFSGRGSYVWCPRCNSKVDDQCGCEAGL